MPGPMPKPAELRQRRNRPASGASLPAEGTVRRRVPPLPEHPWHVATRAWWRDLWRSPMSGELIAMDRHAITRLAYLVDGANWSPGDAKLEETIARLSKPFGLTPLDRRRLEWRIGGAPAVAVRAKAEPPVEMPDPRSALRVI